MYAGQLSIKRFGHWSPPSTPPDGAISPATQVNTNGRGAVVYLLPKDMQPDTRGSAGPGGQMPVTPRPPKTMMDPTDRSTWQRQYRFT